MGFTFLLKVVFCVFPEIFVALLEDSASSNVWMSWLECERDVLYL